MSLWEAPVVLAAAGALGSIPFGLLIARIWTGADVRRVGSGNIGATNVLRASGPWAGGLTLLLDAGKGAASVLIAQAAIAHANRAAAFPAGGDAAARGLTALGRPALDEWAALAAVAGHMFSPWLGFQGGKGVATAAGALLVLSPGLACIALGAFTVVFLITRIVSLSSVLACLVTPVAAGLGLVSGSPSILVLGIVSALVLFRHKTNIRRLLEGDEPRFGRRHRPPDLRGSGDAERRP